MSSPKAVPKSQTNLDKLSFAKYMKNIGRAYRKQAMELVSACRTFVQAGDRSISQDADLRKVLAVVDDALSSAADTKSSVETDQMFEEAIKALSDYEEKYHPKQQNVTNKQLEPNIPKRLPFTERMKSARDNDNKSSLKVLHRLKQSVKAKLVEGPMKVAKFLVPGSLPDSSPRVVEQMLGRETKLEEILWNFSRLGRNKRITLKQNPCFYDGLPRTKREYSGDFENEPIDNFWDATEIWVLTDDRSPVFLEADNKKRAFGNFWVPAEAIIFKDISGKLEGESIVAKDICGTPNLWRRTGPTNPSDLPPIITNPVKGKVFDDWKLLVRDALDSPNISICISTKSTPPESDNWVLSSPTNPTPSSPTQPLSTVQATPTGASSGSTGFRQLAALQVPGPSLEPPTALGSKNTPSTHSPVSRPSLTVISSPLPPATNHQRSPVATPPSPLKRGDTPISQDPPVTVLSSLSLTVAFTPSQARPPSINSRPEPPAQKATSAGTALTSSNTLIAGGIASSPPNTTLTSSTRSSGLYAGDTQTANRTSVPDSAIAIGKGQAPSPGQQQPESGAASAKGKKQNWFQKIRTYFW